MDGMLVAPKESLMAASKAFVLALMWVVCLDTLMVDNSAVQRALHLVASMAARTG